MKRVLALVAIAVVILAIAVPAGAKKASKGRVDFTLQGEARALEVGVGDQGATLGLALSRVDSSPSAVGVGAGQCTLVGDQSDPDDLPCNESTTEKSRLGEGDAAPSCAENLDALAPTLLLQLACGSSLSQLVGGLPSTRNMGRIAGLDAVAPVSDLLGSVVNHDELVNDLSQSLENLLGEPAKQITEKVDEIVTALEQTLETDALEIEVGRSHSKILPKGHKLMATSDAAGARIGLVAVPEVDATSEDIVSVGTPLENGLVIIEVGRATASASFDRRDASSTAQASPALVTVKVRDVTADEPTYRTVTVAPGETITVLQGTPAESTITAADAVTEDKGSSARAAADAVRLHLLKGVQGGITVGLGRATAAAAGQKVLSAPPAPATLPVTGGRDLTLLAVGLLAGSFSLLALRRRFGSR